MVQLRDYIVIRQSSIISMRLYQFLIRISKSRLANEGAFNVVPHWVILRALNVEEDKRIELLNRLVKSDSRAL